MSNAARNATLLVVDDNEMNRDLLSRGLRRADYDVEVAKDGTGALEAIADRDFDLVLLDIMMPGVSGMEVLERIRENHDITDLPVVMVTAKVGSDVVSNAFELGANDYVTKPLEMEEVRARVETHLEVRDKSASEPEEPREESGRGDFHRLSGLEEPTTPNDEGRWYCPECTTVLVGQLERCNHCQFEQPEGGWPEIGAGEFPFLGRTIAGRFYLRRLIGSGHIGAVYHARDLDLSQAYAVKIVDVREREGDRIDSSSLRERTRREAEILSRLSNPHVAKIHEVVEIEAGLFGLVMDYIDGETLAELIDREGSPPPLKALAFARQMAQGLYEAHEQGVVHCDLKPANFMVEQLPVRGEFLYILDFGISQFLQTEERGPNHYTGTPEFSAPEQIAPERDVDPRTDVYGLGGVLYYMVTGELPYKNQEVSAVLQAHLNSPPPSIMDRVSSGRGYELLDQVIRSMMAKDVDDRIQDMSEFIDCIDAIQPVLEREQ
jgi:CheY-like chemotaxis protein/tRNA A-37 threonylcarbamoyl transferase component Bud32